MEILKRKRDIFTLQVDSRPFKTKNGPFENQKDRCCTQGGNWILNPARLPIPPLEQFGIELDGKIKKIFIPNQQISNKISKRVKINF